jgi:glycosyltransferase involved in cell wall biosynthesis
VAPQTSARTAVYITAVEDVAQSPLIRSQVFAVLRAMRSQAVPWQQAVVALYPVANWLRQRSRLAGLRMGLAQAGVALHVLPIFFFTRHFYMSRPWLALYYGQALLAAAWIALRLRPALTHCRSYPATLVGAAVKRLSGARLIFDGRALYPEEGAGRLDGGKSVMLDQRSFALWKRIEAQLVGRADAIACVSRPMADILAEQYPAARDRLLVAPTCTPVPAWADLAAWRSQTRAELALGDRLTIAYAGSWFDPPAMIALLRQLRAAAGEGAWPTFGLLLLVSSRSGDADATQAQIAETMRAALPEAGCIVLAARPADVVRYLAGADLAVQPVSVTAQAMRDTRFLLQSRTMLSVKFTEYLAAGLPVVISRWAGAAAQIVRDQDLGIVYDEASPEELVAWLARISAPTARADFRARAWAYARDHFAVDALAQRYRDLYHRLLSS